MAKRTYFSILFVLTIIIAGAFKLQSFPGRPSQKVEEEPVPEINYALEIQDALSKYDSLLSVEISETATVGAAVAITYKNQIAFLKCFGVRKVGEADSINENTIFRLASVSKTMTGILAGKLADEKMIDLDDKIIDFIPGFRLKDQNSTNNLTIRNILSHTSGLVPHAFDNMVEEHVPFRTIMASLNLVDISAPPGQLYGYQNVVFSLYDTIAAAKTAKKFGELIQEKLFDRVNMKDASIGFEAFEASNNKAFPHQGGDRNYRVLRLNDRYYSTAPAAGVNASISDLGHFLLALLNRESTEINDNVRNLVFTPQVVSPLSRNYFRYWEKAHSKQYAIGWRTVNYKNRDIAYHGGYVSGYRAEIALCFDENIGIAFLSNSPNEIGTKSIPAFLNLFFGQKDREKLQSLQP